MSDVRITVLGCGRVARLHARILRRMGGVTLAFASRDAAKAEAYRREFAGARAFGSYEEACTHPDVDAVLVCTPTAQHAPQAERAAAAGKAVIVEKPAARNVAELDRVRAVVRERGVLGAVAENYRFKPLLEALRFHIARGDIGVPQFLELSRAGSNLTSGWRGDAGIMGGGALLEGGVHWVHLLCELGGTPGRVVAVRPATGAASVAPFEDALDLLVSFTGGPAGRLFHSWNTRSRIFGLGLSRILGTEGNIHFESNGVFALVLGRRTRLRIPGLLDIMGYKGMWRHLLACLRTGAECLVSLDVARRDLAVVEAAYRSLESGRFEAIAVGG
jgi:UDP-N-acetylglucosamine 3-dehydrogenase